MIEALDDEKPSLRWEDYRAIAWRRRRWFVVPLFLGWLLTWAVSWVLPANFRSDALVLVEGHVVPKDYVTPNVNANLQDRLQSMTQQILSRPRLQEIVEQFHLYSENRGVGSDEAVEKMRKNIQITALSLDDLAQSTGDSSPTAPTPLKRLPLNLQPDSMAFQISYIAPRPVLAQRVTNRLTSLFIEENLRAREQQSQITTTFLENQVEEAQRNMQGQAQLLQQFKAQHAAELPGESATSAQLFTSLEIQLQAANEALNRAEQQKLYLDTLAGQYQTLQANLRMGKSGDSELPSALDDELARLRRQLADLNGRYTEHHPDIVGLKEQIAETENLKQRMEADLSRVKANSASDGSKPIAYPTSYAELNAMSPMLQIESQQASNKGEIENRQAEVRNLGKQLQQVQVNLSAMPMREQQLAELNASYQQARINYDLLLSKKSESELATNLEKRQVEEQYTILSSPTLPEKPNFPNRLLFSLIGLGAGIVVGGLTLAIAELSDDRVHGDRQLKKLVAAPLLGEIPTLATASELNSQARRKWWELAAATTSVVVIAAGTLLSLYH